MNKLNETMTLSQQVALLEEKVRYSSDREWIKQSEDIAELMGLGEWGSCIGDTLTSVKGMMEDMAKLEREVHRLRTRERATYDAGFKEGVNCETSEWEVWTGATRADMKYAMTKA